MDYSRVITYGILIFQCSKLKAREPRFPQSQRLHVFPLSHHILALQERLIKTPLLSWFKLLTFDIRKVDLSGCDSRNTIPQLEQRKTGFSLSLELYAAISVCRTLKSPNIFSHTCSAESKSIIKDIYKHEKVSHG